MRIAVVTNSVVGPRIEMFERLCTDYNVEVTLYRYFRWWNRSTEHVKIVDIPSMFSGKLPFREDIFFHLSFAINRRIKQKDYDLVLAYGYGSPTTYIAMWTARQCGIKTVLWTDARPGYEKNRYWLTRRLKRMLHPLSDEFIASGSGPKRYLIGCGIRAEDICVIPYAIDNSAFRAALDDCLEKRDSIRKQLGADTETVVILYAGKIVLTKGLRELITAFQEIAAKHPCRLVLVGAGPDEGALRRLAQGLGASAQVLFAGHVKHEKIAQYYAASDLFVLPSYTDVWGLVVNEAMVAGLPVIVTSDVGAAEDLVNHGENGFIVDAKDSSALAEVLSLLVENEPLRKTMGRASYSRISMNDIDFAVRRLAEFLRVGFRFEGNTPEAGGKVKNFS